MPLLNYTTTVSADKSVAEISKSLAKVGARKIMYDYDDSGNIEALSFQIKLNDQYIAFRLPTSWKPVLEVLKKQRVPRNLQTDTQASRVAWRITKDWVEAQFAYIETMMVTTAQVFLPYAVTREGDTLYEHIASNPQLLLSSSNDNERPKE